MKNRLVDVDNYQDNVSGDNSLAVRLYIFKRQLTKILCSNQLEMQKTI